jgi:hypothetical protein
MSELTLEVLLQGSENRLLDFGPTLGYRELCSGYTVEKLSMWEHLEDDQLQVLVLQAPRMPRARAGGVVYGLSHEEMLTLDKERGQGVECARKMLPIWAEVGGALRRTTAWVYVHNSDRWVERINFDQNFKPGKHFRQSDRAVDTNPVLHNRYSFFDPVYNNGHVGEGTEKTRRYVRRKNRAVSRQAFFIQMRRRLASFVNDE